MEENLIIFLKYVEIKKHPTKQSMDQKKKQSQGKKIFVTNENKSATYQNILDVTKSVLRVKYKTVNVHIKKEERFQINNLTVHFETLKNEEQTKPKASRQKKIKIRVEIIKIGNKRAAEIKSMKQKNGFFKGATRLTNFQLVWEKRTDSNYKKKKRKRKQK